MMVIVGMGMREKIILAAARLFVVNGYNAVSMREIAEACNITKAALYYHFENKQDLILEIFRDYLLEMGGIIDACCQESLSFKQRVTQMVRAILSQPADRRGIIRLATQEMANLDATARADFGVLYQANFIGKITNLFEEGVARQELRPLDSHLTTWIFLGMMYPFFYPGQERAQNYEQVIPTLLTIFFNGICIPPSD